MINPKLDDERTRRFSYDPSHARPRPHLTPSGSGTMQVVASV